MAISAQEKQEIINDVLSALRTNSRTIDQLSTVPDLADNDKFEINGGKNVEYSTIQKDITDNVKDTLITQQLNNDNATVPSNNAVSKALPTVFDESLQKRITQTLTDETDKVPSNAAIKGTITSEITDDEEKVPSNAAVKNALDKCAQIESSSFDFAISDQSGNIVAVFKNGEFKTKNFDSEKIIKIKDIQHSDLEICDDKNNIILRLFDGHIQTKNFDSKNITPTQPSANSLLSFFLNKFKNKTIGIVGDSISTFKGYLPSDLENYDGAKYETYYPAGNVTNASQTWWYKALNLLGLSPLTNLSNCAWSGSRVTGDSTSVTNASAGCSNRRVQDLKLRLNGQSPDIIICFISCNDWANNIKLGDWKTSEKIPDEGIISNFRSAYALMLYKLHQEYGDARIFCCTNLDDTSRDKTEGWPSNNSNDISTDEWNQNIIEIARAFGCDVINLHECGLNFSNMKKYCVDNGLHPNDEGHTIIANKIVSELFIKY